jgi:transposase
MYFCEVGKIKNPGLSLEQRGQLEGVFRDATSAAVRKRAQMVLLKADGRSADEVAGIVKCCAMTVNNWLERYSLEGIDGLYTKEGRGRKPLLDRQQDRPMVTTTIAEHRQSLKAAHAALLQESGKEFSAQTLRRFLKVLATVTKGCANTSASNRPKKR